MLAGVGSAIETVLAVSGPLLLTVTTKEINPPATTSPGPLVLKIARSTWGWSASLTLKAWLDLRLPSSSEK